MAPTVSSNDSGQRTVDQATKLPSAEATGQPLEQWRDDGQVGSA